MRPLLVLLLLLALATLALAGTVSEEAILFQIQGGPYSQDNGPMFDTFEACERSLAYQQALVKLAGIPPSTDGMGLVLARCFRIYFCVKNGVFSSPCRATGK